MPVRSRGVPPSPETILASAARTATATSSAFKKKGRGVLLVINATASAATPSVVVKLQQYLNSNDTWTDVLAGAAITAAGCQKLLIHPEGPDVANESESTELLGAQLRVVATAADADSLTYSVIAFHLP